MQFNESAFFTAVRTSLFGGKMSTAQVGGLRAIGACFEQYGTGDLRHLAYIYGTTFHETGARMAPVREGQGARPTWTDAQARNAVRLLYNKGIIKQNYALPEPNGLSYYGRGLPQLTWPDNYKKMGALIGVDLYADPDKMLDLAISARVLVEGVLRAVSLKGDFTGRAIEDFIHGDVCDYLHARQTVNGMDDAALIAGYAEKFEGALKLSWLAAGPAAALKILADIDVASLPRLAKGAKGDAVQLLQRFLNAAGAKPPLEPDGGFGELTLNALTAFELAHGLAGVADQAVWAALQAASTGAAA